MSRYSTDLARYRPCFQPLVDLTSGCIEGYEALARYRADDGRLISAGPLFAEIDTDPEAILTIDRHLRRQALEHFAAQPEAGCLTLNISPDWIDLLGGDASPTIEMVKASGIDPKRVIIEITEGRGQLEAMQRIVADYHRAGLRVAIDDFGAGASQIDRIVALGPDIIKLDMQLFRQASKGGLSADVTLAATSIAGRAGCDVVCEGVETDRELHFSIECGARYVQGFIFHPALEETLPRETTLSSVRQLQGSYLARKTDKLRCNALHNQRLREQVTELREHLKHCPQEPLDAQSLKSEGILRYYLCDPDGNQLTDNIEITEAGFEYQNQYRHCNWSHRPYFPLLVALEKSRIHRKLIVSDDYRDTDTHKLCKTYGTYINEGEILLVDVAVEDDVLYA